MNENIDPGVAYIRKVRALELFDAGAVQFGAFKIALHDTQPDAPLSPIFFNLRTAENLSKGAPGPLTKPLVNEVGLSLWSLICKNKLGFDWICGLPNAGEPFADAIAEQFERTCRPKRVLRLKKAEVDGKRVIREILTPGWKPGEHVLVVDDLITQASVKRLGIEALRQHGLKVSHCVVLIDREQGGKHELAQRDGVTLHACYTMRQLLDLYEAEGRITKAKADEVRAYSTNNHAPAQPLTPEPEVMHKP